MLEFQLHSLPDLQFKKAIKKPMAIQCCQIDEPFKVHTKEGIMNGKKGDWLMVGVKGELYVCNQDIFQMTYDLIDEMV